MEEETKSSYLEDLKCKICLEFPEIAMETKCCSNLFCQNCIELVKQKKKSCPLCRKANFQACKTSPLITRMIGEAPVECEYCKFQTTFSLLKTHYSKCESKPSTCTLCKFRGCKNDFLSHLIECHSQNVLKSFSKEGSE